MNILILNGSPKGERSNTMHLTNAFIKGIQEIEHDCIIETTYLCNIMPVFGGIFTAWFQKWYPPYQAASGKNRS